MMIYSSFNSWISQFLACMGSCIGCCATSQRYQVNKQSISDGFWSTSTCDLDTTAIVSRQRSVSSITIPNHSLTRSTNHTEFVNHGLLLWNQSRLQWCGTKKSQSKKKAQESVLSWNASYEALLGTSKRFVQPVPLSEMVDFLVDIWDQEGLL